MAPSHKGHTKLPAASHLIERPRGVLKKNVEKKCGNQRPHRPSTGSAEQAAANSGERKGVRTANRSHFYGGFKEFFF